MCYIPQIYYNLLVILPQVYYNLHLILPQVSLPPVSVIPFHWSDGRYTSDSGPFQNCIFFVLILNVIIYENYAFQMVLFQSILSSLFSYYNYDIQTFLAIYFC